MLHKSTPSIELLLKTCLGMTEICVGVGACVYVCDCMHVCMCVPACTCVYVCVCLHAHVCVCECVTVSACTLHGTGACTPRMCDVLTEHTARAWVI